MSNPFWSQFRATTESDLIEARDRYRMTQEHRKDPTEAAQAELGADLIDLYFDSKPLLKEGGKLPPHNFRRDLGSMIAEARSPVRLAEIMVAEETDGFRAVIDVGHPEMTVETLVVDDSKSYHRMLSREAVERSRKRLAQAQTV